VHEEAKSVVLEYALELNDSASLCCGRAHESWTPFVADVPGHGGRFSQLEVAIYDVGQIGELDAEVLLVLSRPLFLVVEEIVALVLEVHLSIVQNVTVNITAVQRSDVPVAENRSCLCHPYFI